MSCEENLARVQAGLGNFGQCLVGGSPEEQARGKTIKRRALVISVALQTLVLGTLVLAPMLAKPAEIKTVTAMPIPPYGRPPQRQPQRTTPQIPHRHLLDNYLHLAPIEQIISHPPGSTDSGPEAPTIGPTGIPGADNKISIADSREPARPVEPPKQMTRLHKSSVDPALLVRRVEPLFPALARQIRRSGKVELHAIIATDGSIQSLEVVSGDPLFVPSALAAVRQWRYRPTMLNDQPVEIDTFITVVYTVSQP
jgi:periplasmic protein TonB